MTLGPQLTKEEARENVRRIAKEFEANGDQLGWFDAVYRESEGRLDHIPWADLEPNPFFKAWAEDKGLRGDGRKALVVGCGLGDDARYLHDLGFKVTAFDISPTAIEWAKKLHSDTDIQFEVTDLFKPPKSWLKTITPPATAGGTDKIGAFDFVLEVYTVQPLPMEMRPQVIDSIAAFVRENGKLVVVARGREDDEKPIEIPWALSREDLSRFEANGLTQIGFVELVDDEEEPVRRFVVEYQRV